MKTFHLPRGKCDRGQGSSSPQATFDDVCGILYNTFLDETRETIEILATVLQWFFGNHDYIFFTLARRDDYETFHSHCCFGLCRKLQQSDVKLLPSQKKRNH